MKSKCQIKQHLYEQCVRFVEHRHSLIQHQIAEIQESLSSETKSSAGDKHETGRAMLQLEREKVGQQLAEIEKLKAVLSKIDPTKSSEVIVLGSALTTSKTHYFIAISAGELQAGAHKFYAISPNTPMGLLLMGRRVGDDPTFRETQFKIEEVF